MNKARVLVVDDSALMRELLKQMLGSAPELEVVGAAPDPLKAWDLVQRLRPDVMTLDVEMPGMDGISFLEKLMRARPMPVVMVSSLTEAGCNTTLRALEAGAVDFVTKPKLDVGRGMEAQRASLVAKVRAAAAARPRPKTAARPEAPSLPVGAPRFRSTEAVVAIGASTGGTEALREVLEAMPADGPGVVVVQHMPEHFTRHFAERLDGLCAMRVREAEDGARILPGHVLIAPGGARHLEIVRSGAQYAVRLIAAPPVNHHRPSVDRLFHSCASAAGANAIGVILTGMGGDGAQGLLAMRHAGARTIGQDEATCVVYGMPREAALAGAVEYVSPLGSVAGLVLRLAQARAA